jgi:hypothetical protein
MFASSGTIIKNAFSGNSELPDMEQAPLILLALGLVPS